MRTLIIGLLITLISLLPISPSVARSNKLLVVDSQDGEPYKTTRTALTKELERLEYIGKNGLKIVHYSLGHYKGRARNIWKFEAKKKLPNAVFVNGTLAAIAFKEIASKNSHIPFFFAAVTDPVGAGLIDGFQKPPKSNFTGVAYPVPVGNRFDFIRQAMPKVRNIGLIYADMPQSKSYRKWIEDLLKNPEYNQFNVFFRKVEFVQSDGGHIRMAWLAEQHVRELDPLVDAFLSPNDQMGAQAPYAKMVFRTATKPLIGLGKKDISEDWGATMSIFADQEEAGRQVAEMIISFFKGTPVEKIYPQEPRKFEIAFDMKKIKRFNINITDALIEKAGDNIF